MQWLALPRQPNRKLQGQEQQGPGNRAGCICLTCDPCGRISANMPTLTFNHAMVYSRDVGAALWFYRDLLGFKVLEDFRHEERCIYARLKAPRGNATIALHQIEPGKELHPGAIRLYFETDDLRRFCKSLEKAGAMLTQQPKKMPWGWTHAYLDDPDGHEVSVYSAGQKRLKRTARA